MAMNKWRLEENELIRRRMGKTGEELAELSKVTNRVLLQGIYGIDPETGESNRDQLIKEIADVYAQLDKNVEALCLPVEPITERREHKKSLMDEWEALYVV